MVDERTQTASPDKTLVLLVALGPMDGAETRIDGTPRTLPPACPGDSLVFDLATSSLTNLAGPYDFVRFYLPAATLDRLAAEQGLPREWGLRTMPSEIQDAEMQGSPASPLEALQRSASRYRGSVVPTLDGPLVRSDDSAPATQRYTRSGLAPWQLRRVLARVEDNLDADLSTADLAAACSLSQSHFARAFSASMGTSPHKWLVNRRIERAKAMLLGGAEELSQIALACGFADQSHFTRVFARSEGQSPGRWRRLHRH
jgi:AraC-like DNA-binding protein